MKTKIMWFLAGFLAAFAFLHARSAYEGMPIDQTAKLPESTRESLDKAGLGFLRNAYGLRVGDVRVYTPFDKDKILAYLMIGSETAPSQVIIYDNNSDGIPDYIGLLDKLSNRIIVADMDGNGEWDQWTFTKRVPPGLSYTDTNMDGQPDIRDSDTKDVMIFIQNGWRRFIKEGTKKYADVDGEKIEVDMQKNEAGAWVILSPNQAL